MSEMFWFWLGNQFCYNEVWAQIDNAFIWSSSAEEYYWDSHCKVCNEITMNKAINSQVLILCKILDIKLPAY